MTYIIGLILSFVVGILIGGLSTTAAFLAGTFYVPDYDKKDDEWFDYLLFVIFYASFKRL